MNNDDLLRGTFSDLLEQVTEHVDAPAQLGRLHQTRHWQRVGGVVAIAFLFVVIVGGVLLIPQSDTRPIAEQTPHTSVPTTTISLPVTTTSEATNASVPLTGVELIATQWTSQRLGDDPLAVVGAGSVAYVGPKGFIIAGSNWTPENVWLQARLWKSADGEIWGVVPGSGTLFPERTMAAGIVAGERGMVAWGEAVHGGTIVWFSPNGTDWTVASEIDRPHPTDGIVLESGAYVLYGNDSFREEETPRVLFSEDGSTWDIIPTPVGFSAMVQLDSGQLVATGGEASEPMTWTSTDGRAWTPLSDDHSISQGRGVLVTTMVAAGPGLVAAGMNSDGEPTFWASVDGRTFQETASFPLAGPVPEDALREQPPVQAIAVGPEWMVAVGNYGYFAGDGAIWVSRDGVGWEPLPVDLIGRIEGFGDVTYGESTFIAIGYGGGPVVLKWEPSSP